ncbi:M20/M25/M40 family metallo-hydrolase [Flammeovirga yaeyamensis]|uniref:M20/M25/M40 family metallo-hydrolase n=1 Tax=Flammeovirga yaeyamensis TaxID=367791 RepID=A0AAX1NAL4_9BACT|nr:M20 family metallo-hydrolase [Flammeovirga yaeyamensis]MBB3697701.1 acetylornithine deacetylase [Flammeovirga yaeyamensis]NMF35939.1 M20 family metallo-hydrolase [Flammeovirga yaeyamensis]QWG03112.1 M20/M25/M40 family metallo-hydrolase [Flammeovirga yaeyamensis]
MKHTELVEKATALLKQMIATESLSREEDDVAEIVARFFIENEVEIHQYKNNILAQNVHFDEEKETILLNSHIDTVKPNKDWTLNPFEPKVIDDKLYGLGSNDAGGCLVSLIATFLYFYKRDDLPFNLVICASAEEEVSGKEGIADVWDQLPKIDFAIVGEPTLMQMAVAEKGLMVLDCVAEGESGHAARNEGVNAIYKAIKDIDWFRNYQFPKTSPTLGPIKMSVTVIDAGTQHNVVPSECKFVVDVRTTDAYSNLETLEIIKKEVGSTVTPRSTRLNPSGAPMDHPVIKAGLNLQKETYGSPTLSDQALMPIPSLKMGPGDSARSHTADEFIYLSEIAQGVEGYIKVLEGAIIIYRQ